MRRLLCRLRRHRPEVRVEDEVWRCACGKARWRDAHSIIVMPDAGLMIGFERLPDEQ